MSVLIQRLAQLQQSLGTILVVGAGVGTDLPAWRELHGERLILAEAHPRQAEELARRVESSRGEDVWPLAIVATPTKQATLQILNNPLHSSLKPPVGLAQHYPNLRVIAQTEITARSLDESVESLTLATNHLHLLVLDAPGQAGELLTNTPPQVLQAFTWIIVHCGVEPLYADDKGLSDVTSLLRDIGFDIEAEDPEAIYPQATILLKRNDMRVEINHLKTRLRKRDEECAAQTNLAAERDKQLQKLTQERDENAKLADQHKAELDQATQQTTEQQKIAADRQAQLQKVTHERDEQAQLATKHKAELDKANKQNQERITRIAQLEDEQAEVTQRQIRINQEMAKAEAQIDLIKDVVLREPGM